MLRDYFANAKPISNLKTVIDDELKKVGLNGNNTLWATSICSDEANQSIHVLDDYFKAHGPFVMGGISGIPFAGKTGFKAFASHIPDDGGAVLIYGPHIGYTNPDDVGKVKREGQKNPSACCGSIVAGLSNIKSGSVLNIPHNDYQQGQVNKVLTEHYNDIGKAKNDLIAATNITYKQIKRELTDIIDESIENLDSKPLLLIGGVIINEDWGKEDQFEVRDITWYNE